MFSWGYNNYGQLGDSTTAEKWSPVRVRTIKNVTQISSGNSNGYALKVDGSVWAWGYNADGRCGDGTTTVRRLPVQVNGEFAGTFLQDIMQISGGAGHALALTKEKHVWAWGYGANGELGNGATANKTRPVQVTDMNTQVLDNVEEVVTRRNSSYAIRADGSVWAWGYNNYGQLAVGDKANKTRANKVKGPMGEGYFENPIAIGTCSQAMYIANTDGRVYSVGYNGYGQLGDKTTVNKEVLVLISMESISFNSNLVRLNEIGDEFQIEPRVDLGFNLVKAALEDTTYTYTSRDTSVAWVSPLR